MDTRSSDTQNHSNDLPESKLWQKDFEEAVQLHQKGVAGNAEAVKQAHSLLKKIHSNVPDNHLVEAYFGSVTTLLGRDEVDPLERFKKVNKGLKMMDRVISQVPEDLEVRILRANICLRLPETFFHRTGSAIEDFSYLISRYEQEPSIFTADFYQQLLQELAEAYQTVNQNDEAQRVLSKLGRLAGARSSAYSDSDRSPQKKEGSDQRESAAAGPEKAIKQHWPKKGGLSRGGINLYRKALAGDLGSAREAEEYFESMLEQAPDDLELQAYHADSMSLVGRYAADTFTMFGSAIKAAKAFDSVVGANPKRIEARFMRAYHSFRLPEAFFKRTAKCIEDFKYLIESYERKQSSFPEESYWQLLFDLGVAYERLNMNSQAQETWENLLARHPSPEYVSMVRTRQNEDRISLPDDLSINDRETYLHEAKRLHRLGAAGNRKAAVLAQDLWENAAREYPEDWVVQAYYGANLALIGRDSNDPQLMFGNGMKGLKIIKEALAEGGNNPEVLRLKALLLYSLPEAFFHLTSQSIKDFQSLIRAYKNDGNILTREEYEEVLYTLGMAHQRMGSKEQAEKVWGQLLSETANTRYQKLIYKEV